MTSDKAKWIEAVTKLIQLTQADRLKWAPSAPPEHLNQPDANIVEVVFRTHYKDRTFRLYEVRQKIEDPGPLSRSYSLFAPMKYPYWRTSYVLEFTDAAGHPLFTFPPNDPLRDLYTAVQFQTAGVSEFLDDLLDSGE